MSIPVLKILLLLLFLFFSLRSSYIGSMFLVQFFVPLKHRGILRFALKSALVLNSAAAASKSLQSCPTLCDPIDGSLPGSPSLGFSRQEHWSGLPFPSPMHKSKK